MLWRNPNFTLCTLYAYIQHHRVIYIQGVVSAGLPIRPPYLFSNSEFIPKEKSLNYAIIKYLPLNKTKNSIRIFCYEFEIFE